MQTSFLHIAAYIAAAVFIFPADAAPVGRGAVTPAGPPIISAGRFETGSAAGVQMDELETEDSVEAVKRKLSTIGNDYRSYIPGHVHNRSSLSENYKPVGHGRDEGSVGLGRGGPSGSAARAVQIDESKGIGFSAKVAKLAPAPISLI